jgi:tetratricopeptide (TPR) repeat protein
MLRTLAIGLALYSVLSWSQEAVPLRPVRTTETDKQIAISEQRVRKAPSDFAAYDQLGSVLFQKARETGDVQYYDLAERNLKRAIELGPQDFRSADPLLHVALVYMGEHRFTDALAYAQKAMALGSGKLEPLAIEGDAYTDMGEYDDALAAYDALRTLGASTASPLDVAYMHDSRLAYLRFLQGDGPEAIRLMRAAITAALQIEVPRENLAWLYFELGERYFQTGDLLNAGMSYEAGIRGDSNHYRSLAGLAKVRAAQGRYEEAIQLYERSLAVIPYPPHAAELGDLFTKLGRTSDAKRQYDLVEYIGRISQLNHVAANRELALFYADRDVKLPEALALAQKELDVRHDIYTWDALAWVFHKSGHGQEAVTAIDKALRLKTADALILFHAGMIYHRAGNNPAAEDFLTRALKTNPHFHVLYASAAAKTLEDISSSRVQNTK